MQLPMKQMHLYVAHAALHTKVCMCLSMVNSIQFESQCMNSQLSAHVIPHIFCMSLLENNQIEASLVELKMGMDSMSGI